MRSVAFISRLAAGPWGASEELWSRAALDIVREGWRVGASVHRWSPPPERIVQLEDAGVNVQVRTQKYPFWKRLSEKIYPSGKSMRVSEVEKFFALILPDIVVFNDGGAFPPIELLELCLSKRLPFVTLSHTVHEENWPDDNQASRYRTAFSAARRCYFVSDASRVMLEKQIGCELQNAEIVRNPLSVNMSASPPWPPLEPGSELRFACVGRLYPPDKGQHILLEALADPKWRGRNWSLRICGEGPMRDGIERLVKRYGLQERVEVCGYVPSIENVWAENHVLVMPSRREGWAPLAMLEAMICGRPAVTTDVAGQSEIIEDGVTGFLAEAPTPRAVKEALERVWERRMDLEAIGKAAATRVRSTIPTDAVRIFAEKIKALTTTSLL